MLETLASWVADPACAGNAMTLTIAGIIYTNEENYVEALKACHTGLSLEMYVCTLHTLTKLGVPACHIFALSAVSVTVSGLSSPLSLGIP